MHRNFSRPCASDVVRLSSVFPRPFTVYGSRSVLYPRSTIVAKTLIDDDDDDQITRRQRASLVCFDPLPCAVSIRCVRGPRSIDRPLGWSLRRAKWESPDRCPIIGSISPPFKKISLRRQFNDKNPPGRGAFLPVKYHKGSFVYTVKIRRGRNSNSLPP